MESRKITCGNPVVAGDPLYITQSLCGFEETQVTPSVTWNLTRVAGLDTLGFRVYKGSGLEVWGVRCRFQGFEGLKV
jgi:hypothetical protein